MKTCEQCRKEIECFLGMQDFDFAQILIIFNQISPIFNQIWPKFARI